MKHVLLTFVFFLMIHPARGQTVISPHGRRVVSQYFTVTPEDTVIIINDPFLIPETIECYLADSLIVENEAYQFLYNPFRIHLLKNYNKEDTLNVRYRRMRVPAFSAYFHHQLSSFEAENDTSKQGGREAHYQSSQIPSDLEKLQRSGSVFRGISMGTDQGMRLQSGLRLQLAGEIARDVHVTASLTDQNIPVQPEGNTQNLQEIDKVFITVTSPSLRADLGDLVLENPVKGLLSYSRKLQGAQGQYDGSGIQTTGFIASAKGQFTSRNFMGQSGNQGPYQLTGDIGQRNIIILAGTERVWIDGELLVRGEDNDYVIEYANGQIIFTRNRLITSDSRITVDFEYSDQKYQKTLYGASGKFELIKDRLSVSTSYLRESDDLQQPLDIVLSDSLVSILSEAGDDQRKAVVDGGTYMGENKGSYLKTEENGVIVYQYTGPGRGDYVVRFSYIGPGQGDYSFQGYGIYRYEGPLQGDYLPVAFLPFPEFYQAGQVMAELNLGKSLSLTQEAAVSEFDENAFSRLDSDDNIDWAWNSTARFSTDHLRLGRMNLGKIESSAQIRRIGDKFRAPGRMYDIEHGRKWGSQEGRYWGEQLEEIRLKYMPVESGFISYEEGALRQGKEFSSNRRLIETQFNNKSLPFLDYRSESIQTVFNQNDSGSWKREKGVLGYQRWGLRPAVYFEAEDRKNTHPDSLVTGFQFEEIGGSLRFERKGIWNTEISRRQRDNNRYHFGILIPYSQSNTVQFKGEYNKADIVNLAFLWTRHNHVFKDSEKADQLSNLADLTMQIQPAAGIRGAAYYRFSSSQAAELVRDTIQVGDGLGNYRLDEQLNELVPDADGNLLIRNIQTGEFLPVNHLRLGSDWQINFRQMEMGHSILSSILNMLNTQTALRIERRDKSNDFWQVNKKAFHPDWGRDSSSVYSIISIRQDIDFMHRPSGWQLRANFRSEDSENFQLLREGVIRHVEELQIRLRGRFAGQFTLDINWMNRKDEKDFQSPGRMDRIISFGQLQAETAYRYKRDWEFALEIRYRNAIDKAPDPNTEVKAFFIVPRIRFSMRQKGQIRFEYELGNVKVAPEKRAIPWEMLNGDQAGITSRWSCFMTYRLSNNIQATLNYRGRNESWREKIYHTGQMEIRAFF